MRVRVFTVLALSLSPIPMSAQASIDTFDDVTQWRTAPASGVAITAIAQRRDQIAAFVTGACIGFARLTKSRLGKQVRLAQLYDQRRNIFNGYVQFKLIFRVNVQNLD